MLASNAPKIQVVLGMVLDLHDQCLWMMLWMAAV
jgi:hypothetical protein